MARIAAWQVLRSGSPTPLREVDAAARAHGLDERDRALLRRLVGTEVRRRGNLRAIAAHFVRGKSKPDLVAHLHLGLVQLLFLDRVPDHAAVSETCEAVSNTIGRAKTALVNGVLRNVIRARCEGLSGDPRRDLIGRELHFAEPVFHDPEEHPLLWAEDALSLPAPLMKRWTKRLGLERARDLARSFLEEPPLSVRVVAGEREAVRAELGEELLRAGAHPRILLAPSGASVAVLGSAAFREGRITVQGGAALAAAELVEARPGEELLDLCAAPGGKTAVLAGAGARVLACDVDESKGGLLRAGLERLGVSDRVTFRASDGTAQVHEGGFDGVLVDAPCSNTGVLGARPAARWRFGPASQSDLVALQGRLLREGAEKVRPGGRLVWSTCSLEPEENERLVRAFLEERAGWTLEVERAHLPDRERGPVDGGWAARLRREG